jgi:HPt (histidine-containing phosphotransfer) domain-containing protein
MAVQILDGREHNGRGAPRMRACERRHDMPIDWAHLSRCTMNDKALAQEVLGLFAMEAPRYLAQLHSAASHKAWIEAAHTLKGSARAVGAWAIAECAQAAEAVQLSAEREHAQAATDGANVRTTHGAEQALQRLDAAVRQTLAYIEHLGVSEPAGQGSHAL